MKKISVEFTLPELQAVVTLAENQLFRVKFIDPKMPGYKNQPEQLAVSKAAVQILHDALNDAKGLKARTA